MATATLEPIEAGPSPIDGPPPPMRRLGRRLGRIGRAIASATEWVFGAVALVIGLAVLAAIPVAQFLCLGYLLEAGGRVARSGRLRDAFVGFRKAARLGGMAIGVVLWTLPLQLFASLARSAAIVDPGGPAADGWRIAFVVLAALTVLHLAIATARGGRLRHYLWAPGGLGWLRGRRGPRPSFADCRDATLRFVGSLHLSHYFRLGLLGFVGTIAWVAVPVSLIAAGRAVPPLSLLGILLLGLVFPALPFLQLRFVTEGRFRAFVETRAVRERFRRAPWAFAFALLVTAAAAVPLYLLKIEMIPREAAWLPSLVFLGFTIPARLLTGWAYHRSERRPSRRHWVFRLSARLWLLPVALLYVLFVYFSQFTAWRGVWSLYEQHALLIPVPFLGL